MTAAATRSGPQGLPWPAGNPGQLRQTAGEAAGIASELASRGKALSTAGRSIDSWRGYAHAAFTADLHRNAEAIETSAESFRTAHDAVNRLATVLERAHQSIQAQARQLGDVRDQAERASQRAQQLRDEALTVNQQAMAAAGDGAVAQQAQEAELDAQRAEQEAAEAQRKAGLTESRARQLAEQDVTTVGLEDRRSAALIRHAAQNAPMAVKQAGIEARGYNGLNSLGAFFTLWGPVGSTTATGAAGFLRLHKTYKWGRQAIGMAVDAGETRWWRLALAKGNRTGSLMPTFNNGFVGKRVAGFLGKLPKGGTAAGVLKTTSRATPLFRGLGIAGSAVATVSSGHHVVSKYGWNPVEAYEKGGASYVSGVAKTAFSASSTAFFMCPNPVTAGAVVVTGLAWAGTEIWEHHEAIWDGMKDAGDAIADAGQSAWDAATVWD